MARETLTENTLTSSGIGWVGKIGTSDGQKFSNNGNELLIVKQGDSSTRDVTIVTGGKVGEGSEPITDRTVTVSVGGHQTIGPFRPDIWNQSDGTVHVDFESGKEAWFTCQVITFKKDT